MQLAPGNVGSYGFRGVLASIGQSLREVLASTGPSLREVRDRAGTLSGEGPPAAVRVGGAPSLIDLVGCRSSRVSVWRRGGTTTRRPAELASWLLGDLAVDRLDRSPICRYLGRQSP